MQSNCQKMIRNTFFNAIGRFWGRLAAIEPEKFGGGAIIGILMGISVCLISESEILL